MRVHYLRSRYYPASLCLALLVAVTLISCGGDSKTGPEDDDDTLRPDTPDNVIEIMALAFDSKDLDAYKSLLHDEYLFKFVEEFMDSLGLEPDQPWWGKTKDVHSIGNLFADSLATFSVEFIEEVEYWIPSQLQREDTTYSGFFKRYTLDLRLILEEPGQEPMTIIGDETFVDVVVTSHPYIAGCYTVLEMEEVWKLPGAASLHLPLSLSEVKAKYQ